MIQRILDIIRNKKMTPAQFAEEIGIQRSSISHLVSGRNKPSLEFIQKILAAFPEINPDWLLTGRGEMYLSGGTGMSGTLFDGGSSAEPADEPVSDDISLFLDEEEPTAPVRLTVKDQTRKTKAVADKKQVEKIVYFFKDQTFKEYYPGD